MIKNKILIGSKFLQEKNNLCMIFRKNNQNIFPKVMNENIGIDLFRKIESVRRSFFIE